MTFTSLASSSKGNAYVVSDGETTLLLECGLTFKELQKRLGYGVAGITACLVSHEHQDHAKAAAQLLKGGVPVYMSEGTAAAHKDAMDAAHLIKAGDVLRFGHLTVVPFRTFHNTDEPLGFLIEDGRTKERLLWAVDTANLGVTADKLTYIAVECNYEERLLNRSDRIPSVLKDPHPAQPFRGFGCNPLAAQAGSQRRADHLAAAPVRWQQQGRGMAGEV